MNRKCGDNIPRSGEQGRGHGTDAREPAAYVVAKTLCDLRTLAAASSTPGRAMHIGTADCTLRATRTSRARTRGSP